MSHYPNTQELYELRRSLYWMASGPSDNANAAGWHGPMIHPDAGAWAGERRDGIGYRDRIAPSRDYDEWKRVDVTASLARREASAMRSRAWDSFIESWADRFSWIDDNVRYAEERDVFDEESDTFTPGLSRLVRSRQWT